MNAGRLLVLVLAGIVAAALAGVGRPEEARGLAAELETRGITVTGNGVVTTAPDRADFEFGAQNAARTAKAALAATAAESDRIVAALKAAGVAAADIRTQGVSITPRIADDGQSILGYTASVSVSARLRNLGRVGALIDAAVEAGANQVFGPSLARSDRTGLYRSALKAAVADARAKAGTIAAAAGVSVGRVTAVVEGGGAPPVVGDSLAGAPKGAERSAAVPIEPGTQDIEASVSVTFAVG